MRTMNHGLVHYVEDAMHGNIETRSTRELLVSLLGEKDTAALYTGTLSPLFYAGEHMPTYQGVRQRRAQTKLRSAHELMKRLLAESLPEREVLSDPTRVREYLRMHFGSLEHEVFAMMYLDTRHRFIELETLFRGTIDAAAVYPREVVKSALRHNAAAVIAIHNHVSGHPEPSTADRALTRRLSDALSLVDIRMLDHLVVGQEGTVSFAERGWL